MSAARLPTRPVAGAPTIHTHGGRPARPTGRYRRRQTTDASQQNNTGPLGGPIIRKNEKQNRVAQKKVKNAVREIVRKGSLGVRSET